MCVGLIVSSIALRYVFYFSGLTTEAAYLLTPARLDTLCAGSLLAVALRDPAGIAFAKRWARPAFLASFALLIGIWATIGIFQLEWFTQLAVLPVVMTVCTSLIAMACFAAPGSPESRFFSSRLLVHLGRRSYSIYIFHQAIFILWQTPRDYIARIPVVGESRFLSQLAYIAVTSVVLLIVAELAWRLVEKPALGLKKFFPSKSRAVPELAAAPVKAPDHTPGSVLTPPASPKRELVS